MSIKFNKATVGNSEYSNEKRTKLSIVENRKVSIGQYNDMHKDSMRLFEIIADDSLVKPDTKLNIVWELSDNNYATTVNFTTIINAPYEGEAIQSEPFLIGDYTAECLLCTARCANIMFHPDTDFTHPVIVQLFSSSETPTGLNIKSISHESITHKLELTATDIKKDGESIIGDSSGLTLESLFATDENGRPAIGAIALYNISGLSGNVKYGDVIEVTSSITARVDTLGIDGNNAVKSSGWTAPKKLPEGAKIVALNCYSSGSGFSHAFILAIRTA